MIVEVKCTFQKIGDVDTVAQEFEAEVFIQSKWEEPLLDNMPEKVNNDDNNTNNNNNNNNDNNC